MKLITELNEDVEYVTEANGDRREHYIVGRFIAAEEKNRNGRRYPMSVVEPEIARYVTEVIGNNRAYGELNHPTGPTINLDRVSHIITEIKRDGNAFNGRAKLTHTPMGEIARGLLESGGKLGVSTRGMGSLVEANGAMEVQRDFKLATVDIVSDPSGPGCFVRGILEGVDWIYDPVKGTYFEQRLDEVRRDLHRMTMSEIERRSLALFEDYVTKLSRRTAR
jgi:hypothetical protein